MNKTVVLVVVGIGTALSLIGDSSLYTVLPTHTTDAAISLSAVGVMLSANRWVRLASNGPAGWLSDRLPRRALFIPALFLGALSTAIYGFTAGYWPLLIGRLLWGISWSGIWVSGNTIVLDVATDQNRGRMIGFYNVAFFSGASLGSLLGGWLTDLLGYAMAMRIAALLTLTGAIIVLLFLPETKGKHQKEKSKASESSPSGKDVSTAEMGSVFALIGVNRLLIAGTLIPTFGLFLQQTLGEQVEVFRWSLGIATLTGLGISVSSILGIIFLPVIGGLSDRLGNRWRVASIGLLPGTAGFLLLGLAWPWAIVFGLPLTSATSSSNQGMSTALVGDLAGDRSGRYLGFLFTAGDLASAAGPLLVFWLVGFVDLNAIYFAAAALFGLMCLVAGWWSVRDSGIKIPGF